jgi:hypothetical protein
VKFFQKPLPAAQGAQKSGWHRAEKQTKQQGQRWVGGTYVKLASCEVQGREGDTGKTGRARVKGREKGGTVGREQIPEPRRQEGRKSRELGPRRQHWRFPSCSRSGLRGGVTYKPMRPPC